MAINEKTIIILGELSKRKEPTKPLEIAHAVQVEPIQVGKELVELAKGGLAVKKDKDKNTWAITDEGAAYMKTLPRTTPPAQAPVPGTTSQAVAPTAPAVASTTPPLVCSAGVKVVVCAGVALVVALLVVTVATGY